MKQISNQEKRKNCSLAIKHIKLIEEEYYSFNDFQPKEDDLNFIEAKICQIRECVKDIFHKPLPTWWDALRSMRNYFSHRKESSDVDKAMTCIETFFGFRDAMENDLTNLKSKLYSTNKDERTFEKFGSTNFGSKEDRKDLVDAISDNMKPKTPSSEHLTFPKNNLAKCAKDIVEDIKSKPVILNYINSHNGLENNIKVDIIKWLEKLNSQIENEDPFKEEALFISSFEQQYCEDIARDFIKSTSNIEKSYKALPSVKKTTRNTIANPDINFDFYKQEFFKELSDLSKKEYENHKRVPKEVTWNDIQNLELYKNCLLKDFKDALIQRKLKWEIEKIENDRKQFLIELYKKIDQYSKLEKLLSPFISNLGRLWDLSEHSFKECGFEILETYAALLEKDESLQELARLLGNETRAQSVFNKELRSKTSSVTKYRSKPASKGQIVGLKFSNDVSAAIPSEIALLKNERTKLLFFKKFAEKQLLSYSYENLMPDEEEVTEDTNVLTKGPIIMCIDTSGSMHGAPENIAKTVAFALSKICCETNRKCYVISFSTDIETMDLGLFNTTNSITKLLDFLKMSFYGGTDVEPALEHALNMLSTENYKNADVLVISDFILANLNNDLINNIETQQDNGTCFHSLLIGDSGNSNTIKAFDHNWIYDTSDPKATKHLIEQINELKTRPMKSKNIN